MLRGELAPTCLASVYCPEPCYNFMLILKFIHDNLNNLPSSFSFYVSLNLPTFINVGSFCAFIPGKTYLSQFDNIYCYNLHKS